MNGVKNAFETHLSGLYTKSMVETHYAVCIPQNIRFMFTGYPVQSLSNLFPFTTDIRLYYKKIFLHSYLKTSLFYSF